jgi:HK97 family phage major capsid protein
MASMESAIIRRFATKIPMSSDTINIPKIVDTSHASTLYGGLAGVWTEEAGSLTSDEPAFGQIKLICHKLLLYTITSNELLADFGQALETVILKVFGDSLGWTEDEAFINGDGVGKPLGILKSGALLTINRSAATTVAQSDVLNMWSRLLPQSHERCIWLVNPTVLPQLGAIAATALSWLSQDQGLAKPMPTSILGRPMYISEKCPALGTAGDIILLDPSFYLIGDRKILEMRASEQVRFATDETAWRMIERVAGHPWVDSKFTPLHGSTLSPFVTLYASTTGGD